MKKPLLDAIRERPLLGDGAMGTQLMRAGLVQGNCGEHWNLTSSEKVLAIQRAYVEAGSDCLLTNTFGGSRIMLDRHGLGDEVAAIMGQRGDLLARFAAQIEGVVLGLRSKAYIAEGSWAVLVAEEISVGGDF